MAVVRAQAQPLHHAGTEALDQDVGLARQRQRRSRPALLEVQRQRAPPARHHIEFGAQQGRD
jgi:hypothetical protein